MSWQPHRSLLFLQKHQRSVTSLRWESRGLTGSTTPVYSLRYFEPTLMIFIGNVHPKMKHDVLNTYDFLSSRGMLKVHLAAPYN